MNGRRARRAILPVSTGLFTVVAIASAIAVPGTAEAQAVPQPVPAAFRQPVGVLTQISVMAEIHKLMSERLAAPADPLYTVRTGDTMSGIALRHCGTPDDWTGIYAASRAQHLTARDANDINAGQHLALSCTQDRADVKYAPYIPPPPPPQPVIVQSYQQPVQQQHQTYPAYQDVSYATPVSTYRGSSGMQQCIISRESGGDSQVMNSTGHYGLYQFSFSTWVANGGSAADFGHASVAEQNQVFYNTVARSGYSAWTPYDGC